MTELDINIELAKSLGYEYTVENQGFKLFVYINGLKFDPCNNINQAWVLMLDHDISVTKTSNDTFIGLHCLGSRYNNFDNENLCCDDWVEDKKPLVAAMKTILKIRS
ncbi:hypothetical protein KNT81_gp062 [Proteus phage phiP4-3]|uniref:Uncharacterized protein n=1 Tax=Proteus phage phiP4-3 TaxID=2065203 RepID=A0A2I6PFB6_9CAUD|nr:hypothetical protein KNT81_gp062 [Proteus phage phiP4-3]AUM58420.1 hypothetical protein phiP43_062 [Proteus phage phiP4-3]AZV01334.1 hypothetical protein vBSdyM006_197 [Shigella phage vB_SdyM_006]